MSMQMSLSPSFPLLRLAAMTELEREFELAERSERKQQELQRNRLLRKAQREAEAAATHAEPRASVASTRSKKEALEGDQGGRAMRSGREEREEAAKKSAMQELVAARRARNEGTSRYVGVVDWLEAYVIVCLWRVGAQHTPS